MRLKLLIGALLLAATSVAAQNQTPQERQEFFEKEITKAKWIYVDKDADSVAWSVDANSMRRLLTMVVFIVKLDKKGATEYDKMIGGCTKELLATSNVLVAKQGSKELSGREIDPAAIVTQSEGSIGYRVLNYVCKNAKDIKTSAAGRNHLL